MIIKISKIDSSRDLAVLRLFEKTKFKIKLEKRLFSKSNCDRTVIRETIFFLRIYNIVSILFTFPAVRKESPVIFQSRFFDEIFCFVWLTTLIDSETEKVDRILAKVCDRLKDQKTFESKIFREHLSVKLRLDVLNFRWTKQSPSQARSILKPLLSLFPSNPILLESLSNKSDLRPTVANPFWRESLKVNPQLYSLIFQINLPFHFC